MMITRSVNIEMGHVDESSSRAQSASGKVYAPDTMPDSDSDDVFF
jgi:hypothetical protein